MFGLLDAVLRLGIGILVGGCLWAIVTRPGRSACMLAIRRVRDDCFSNQPAISYRFRHYEVSPLVIFVAREKSMRMKINRDYCKGSLDVEQNATGVFQFALR